MQTISFSELTQSIYDELKFVAFEKKLDFVIEKPKKDIKVVADINKLRQVIVNITDNAIKYTPEGTVKLSLGLENKGKNLIFTVKDSGLGITAEELDYVFKKFSRSGTTKHIKGNGLGLYIAKQFIEAHDGGEIWVASEGEGKGALFGIRMNVVK
jgi:signal transduction histidine kinase